MNNLIQRDGLFDSLFNNVAPGFFIRPLHGEGLPDVNQIKIDVKEVDNKFIVQADVPGVDKENIDLSIEGAVVTIRAEIEQHDEHKEDGKVLRSERYCGSVSRSFQLPDKIDTEEAKATYKNGVLVLTLPKLVNQTVAKLTIK